MNQTIISHPLPYICQYASPELVRAFIYEEQAIISDPNWAAYGASSPEEYEHWARRACGVVCVKMVVDGLRGEASGPVMAWVNAGLAIDGYLTTVRPDRPDQRVEYGWKHQALAQLIGDAGFEAKLATEVTLDQLGAIIRAGGLLIASVSSQLGEADTPLTRNSGHLVVVLGIEVDEAGVITQVILHNPSGRTASLQAQARIPTARFMAGFSGRGIMVDGR